MEDYNGAASYFRQLAPAYGSSHWLGIETSALEMYASCLKKLHQTEDFVRISLKALSKAILLKQAGIYKAGPGSSSFFEPFSDGQVTVEEVAATSIPEAQPIKLVMKDFFSDIRVEPHIRYFPDQDGFSLDISLHSLLPGFLNEVQLLVKLTSLTEGRTREIDLRAERLLEIRPGILSANVTSKVRPYHSRDNIS